MTDTITESFCERCGTRYAFEQNAEHRRGRIGRVRVLTRGLKNYVANDGMPMSEAIAAAEHDETRTGVSRQLDAFHRTFNFCMSCRQYTCGSCWNGKVGECLSCAPDLSREVLPVLFPDLPLDGPTHGDGPAPDDLAPGPEAWPTADLDRITAMGAAAAATDAGPTDLAEVDARLATPAPSDAPLSPETGVAAAPAVADEDLTAAELAAIESALATGHPVAEPAPAAELAAIEVEAPEVDTASESGAQPEPEEPQPVVALPDAPAERASAAQQQTRSLLRRFRPAHRAAGPDAASAAAAGTTASHPEGDLIATAEPVAAPLIVGVAAAAEPELAAEPASPERAPEAAVAEPQLAVEPAVAPAAPPTDAAAPVDAIEQPTWRVVAPESPTTPGQSWPDAPAWPAPQPGSTQAGPLPGSAAAPWAARLATARPEPTNVWAASSQELLAAPGPSTTIRPGAPAVQACVSCGLSLSANARFCRRCGSRQG